MIGTAAGSKAFFRVELLPAAHGDCILLEYGPGPTGAAHYVLVDGGPDATYPVLRERLLRIPEPRKLDLVVLTHIDADHIGGILKLLRRDAETFEFGDFWFNGWPQIRKPILDQAPSPPVPGRRGTLQGAFLGVTMQRWAHLWNVAFRHLPIYVPNAPPPALPLPGGLRLTLLGPPGNRLRALRDRWQSDLQNLRVGADDTEALEARLAKDRRYRGSPTRDESVEDAEALARSEWRMDDAIANGSSLSLLAELEERRMLLLGDAFIEDVTAALRCLGAREDQPLDFDAIKLSHHGSRANVDAAFLRLVRTRRFLISTNGDLFRHPDIETLELLHEFHPKATVLLNYPVAHVESWIRMRQGRANVDMPAAPGRIVDLTTSAP